MNLDFQEDDRLLCCEMSNAVFFFARSRNVRAFLLQWSVSLAVFRLRLAGHVLPCSCWFAAAAADKSLHAHTHTVHVPIFARPSRPGV